MKRSVFWKTWLCLLAMTMTLTAFAALAPAVAAADPVIITLDPGHGSWNPSVTGDNKDPGATGASAFGGLTEAEYNWIFCQYIKGRLEQYNGVKVYLTRTMDVKPSLSQRAATAAAYNSDAFVSIHCNSASSSAQGSEILVPNDNYRPAMAATSKAAATMVLNNLCAATGNQNRGFLLKNSGSSTYPDGSVADYYGIIQHGKRENIPVVMLVETGFVTNSGDYQRTFATDAARKNVAFAIADALASYYKLTKGTNFDSDFQYTPPAVELSMLLKISNDDLKLRGKVGNTLEQPFKDSNYEVWDKVIELDKDKVYDVVDIGWVAVNSTECTFGYIINGKEYYDASFAKPVDAGVQAQLDAVGASNGARFMGVLDTDWLRVGTNSVKFVVKMDGNTVETLRQYTIKATGTETVTEEVTTEAPTEPVTEPVTDPVTDEVTTVDPNGEVTTPDGEKVPSALFGCFSSVAGATALIALVTLAGGALLLRKKEN